MKLYKIEWGNPNKYQSYMPSSNFDFRVLYNGQPLPDNWQVPQMESTDKRCKFIQVDFPAFFSVHSVIIVNERAWPLVRLPLEVSGQCYEVSIDNHLFHLCNPWREIDCVDRDKCEFDRTFDFIIKKYYINMESLNYELPIFKIARSTDLFTLESKVLRQMGVDFKYLVRKNKLTGLIFKKVWESDEVY